MPAPPVSDPAPEKGLLPLDAQDHAHRLFTTGFLHRFSLVLSPPPPYAHPGSSLLVKTGCIRGETSCRGTGTFHSSHRESEIQLY